MIPYITLKIRKIYTARLWNVVSYLHFQYSSDIRPQIVSIIVLTFRRFQQRTCAEQK